MVALPKSTNFVHWPRGSGTGMSIVGDWRLRCPAWFKNWVQWTISARIVAKYLKSLIINETSAISREEMA